jgi:hypothetical protein
MASPGLTRRRASATMATPRPSLPARVGRSRYPPRPPPPPARAHACCRSRSAVKINAEIQRSNRVLHGGFETPERPFQLCRSRFFRPLGFHTVPESPLFSADTVKINAEIQRSNRGLRVTANAGLPTPSFCCQGRRRFAKKHPLGFDPMPESRGVFLTPPFCRDAMGPFGREPHRRQRVLFLRPFRQRPSAHPLVLPGRGSHAELPQAMPARTTLRSHWVTHNRHRRAHSHEACEEGAAAGQSRRQYDCAHASKWQCGSGAPRQHRWQPQRRCEPQRHRYLARRQHDLCDGHGPSEPDTRRCPRAAGLPLTARAPPRSTAFLTLRPFGGHRGCAAQSITHVMAISSSLCLAAGCASAAMVSSRTFLMISAGSAILTSV